MTTVINFNDPSEVPYALAAALLRDVPRYALSAYDEELERQIDGPFVHYHEVLAALPAVTPKVRPLAWAEQNGVWSAETIIGEYSVGFDDGWWCELSGPAYWDWEPSEDRRSYCGPSAAMTAAQADYEARILAALAPTDAAHADDPKCTDCGGTGITYQTERVCACQPATVHHVNETPKSEHDAGNMLTAAQAREAAQADFVTLLTDAAAVAMKAREASLREAAATVQAGDTVQNIQRRILALIGEART